MVVPYIHIPVVNVIKLEFEEGRCGLHAMTKKQLHVILERSFQDNLHYVQWDTVSHMEINTLLR